jgi:diguanylate cyclase (GGDEF)-like protein
VAVIGAIAVGVYFVLPGAAGKDLGYSAIGIASSACVLGAARLRGRGERQGWLLLASGNLCFVLGDGVYDLYQFVLHRPVPFPSVADPLYLAGYPLIFIGVTRLTRVRGVAGARESYADAAIVSIGALALSWHFLVAGYTGDATMATFGKLVTVAYPMMDIAVLFVVLRGLIFGGARAPAHRLLAGSLFAMLVGDFVYDLLTQHGNYSTGNPVDASWLIAYVLVATAAMHPSAAPDRASRDARAPTDRRRLPVVAAAGLVPPAILVISEGLGTSVNVAVMAGLSLVLFGLVTLRMSWLFARLEKQRRDLEESLAHRSSLEAELRHQAYHDALTGLANRALLHDRVGHALASSLRSTGSVALCFCDLDGFKTINDSLGHGTGDQVLTEVANRLVSIVRPGDTVARLGGDEFAILMEDVANLDVPIAVAQRVVNALREPMEVTGRRIDLSTSVGVAVAEQSATAARLLSQADSAMYAAKATGKNGFQVFEQSMLDEIVEQLSLKSALNDAIVESQFFLQYQPQFSLSTGALEGFEALLRWRHPSLGVISPDRFISLAEESGHIVPIGRWVLEAACERCHQWNDAAPAPLTVAVNISGRQLLHKQFVDDVRTALAFSGLAPNLLVLEITESSLLYDPDRLERIRTDLQGLGIRLAIDDFGTGYSSLRQLRDFPVDVLKIDRAFVERLDHATNDGMPFVQAIMDLARGLGLHSVAEGIEREEQREILTAMGCDSAQGYLLGMPLDPESATRLVDDSVRVDP